MKEIFPEYRDGQKEVVYRRHSYEIGCGSSDTVHTFSTREHLYVLSYNTRLNYVGLELIYLKNHEFENDSCSIQNPDEDLEESFIDNHSPLEMVKVLEDYLP